MRESNAGSLAEAVPAGRALPIVLRENPVHREGSAGFARTFAITTHEVGSKSRLPDTTASRYTSCRNRTPILSRIRRIPVVPGTPVHHRPQNPVPQIPGNPVPQAGFRQDPPGPFRDDRGKMT